jgi:hypothetical protein
MLYKYVFLKGIYYILSHGKGSEIWSFLRNRLTKVGNTCFLNRIFLTRVAKLKSASNINFGSVTFHPINLELQGLREERTFLGLREE